MANVKLDNITVKYGERTILDNFSLDIKDGEILGIVGPSGCGKTTILRALCGFVKPDTGDVYINDELVYSKTKRVNIAPERRGIGVVFQDYAVWPHMSVWKNVMYPLKKHKVPKEEAEKKAKFALEQVHLTGYENHMPAQLSGGQQQRVAIARALVSSDSIIVLDEPITNLDAKLREEMILEIRNIQRRIGTTIIYITHDQEAVLELCDRICIMKPDGSIAQVGKDEEIIHKPAERYVFSFIGVSNFIPVQEKAGKLYLEVDEPVLYADSLPADYITGKENEIGVRPMNIVFDETSPIKAKIKRFIFLGNQYNYFLELGNKELRVERNALDVLADATPYKEGDIVGLRFLDARIYPKEGK